MSATGGHQQTPHHGGRRQSPLSHPYVYPACLRFLLGFRGTPERGATKAPPASPAAFLVLQLPGGVGGGTPSCYEACALHAGNATGPSTAGGSERLTVSSVGFEQLDFSADVDVTLGGLRDGEDGGHGKGGGADRTAVIGRLRRVSGLSAAGGSFGRALVRARGRCIKRLFFGGWGCDCGVILGGAEQMVLRVDGSGDGKPFTDAFSFAIRGPALSTRFPSRRTHTRGSTLPFLSLPLFSPPWLWQITSGTAGGEGRHRPPVPSRTLHRSHLEINTSATLVAAASGCNRDARGK